MKIQNIFLGAGLLLAIGIIFSGCEKETFNEVPDTTASELESTVYQYMDQDGQIKSLQINGSTVTFQDQDGLEQKVELEPNNEQGLTFRSDISKISGHLETPLRGKLQINYKDGEGKVFWKFPTGEKVTGEIECLQTFQDQIILGILINKSNADGVFAPGQRIVTTVRDLGRPDAKVKDQIAKILLIFAGPDDCRNPVIPFANSLFGFDDAEGNIVTR